MDDQRKYVDRLDFDSGGGGDLIFEAGAIKTGDDLPPPCFAAGTSIMTPRGYRPAEALCAGDEVITEAGAVRRIIWVGRRSLDPGAFAASEHVEPIRI